MSAMMGLSGNQRRVTAYGYSVPDNASQVKRRRKSVPVEAHQNRQSASFRRKAGIQEGLRDAGFHRLCDALSATACPRRSKHYNASREIFSAIHVRRTKGAHRCRSTLGHGKEIPMLKSVLIMAPVIAGLSLSGVAIAASGRAAGGDRGGGISSAASGSMSGSGAATGSTSAGVGASTAGIGNSGAGGGGPTAAIRSSGPGGGNPSAAIGSGPAGGGGATAGIGTAPAGGGNTTGLLGTTPSTTGTSSTTTTGTVGSGGTTTGSTISTPGPGTGAIDNAVTPNGVNNSVLSPLTGSAAIPSTGSSQSSTTTRSGLERAPGDRFPVPEPRPDRRPLTFPGAMQ